MQIKLISTQNRGGPVLSKVASYQQKSLPTRLVSATYSVWHFFTDGAFKIKYPWTGCLLLKLSCLFQNFLTSLGALYLAGGRAYHHFFFLFTARWALYLWELTSGGGGGAYKQQFTMWSLEFGKLSFTITLLINDFCTFQLPSLSDVQCTKF